MGERHFSTAQEERICADSGRLQRKFFSSSFFFLDHKVRGITRWQKQKVVRSSLLESSSK